MKYGAPVIKSLPSDAHRLQQELSEARGVLQDVYNDGDRCIAVFEWGSVAEPLELEQKLREFLGRKIGILRLDGFRVMCLENQDV